MEFLIKKSRFSVKSRFKESKCADVGHSLNRDFTVLKNEFLIAQAIYTKNKFRSRIRHAIFSGISKQSRIEFTLASKHASIIDVTLDDDFNLFALVNDKDKDKRSHVMSCNLFGLGKKRVISAVDAANEAESGAASLCCISAGRGLVAVGARNGKIILLESERFGKKRLKPKTVLKHHTKAIRQILFPTESNSHIVTCSDDMSIGIITFSPSHSKTHCKLLHGHVSRVRAIDVQRGNVLSGSDDRSVKMWSLAGSNVDQRPLATLTGHSGPVTGVKLYLPLALSVAGSSVRLWDALQGTCLKLLQHEEGVSVTTMTWISTFEGAATVDASGRMRCFDLSADLESSREEASSEIIVASAVKSFASKSSKSSYKIESFPHHFSAVEFTNDLPLPTINVHCLDYV